MNLVLNKKHQVGIGILSAYLEFKKDKTFKNISKVILTKTDKSKVRLDLNKIIVNPNYKKDFFIFIAPKNTRVSR